MKTTLYAKDNRGSIRMWSIESDEATSSLIITHGLLHGVKQTKVESIVLNKSGRDMEEQLALQFNSRVNKQLDKGYVANLRQAAHTKRTNRRGLPRPMLAQKYASEQVKQHLYVQRKYNGVRCMIGLQEGELVAYSRNGKLITAIPHILDQLRGKSFEDGVYLDGELYLHDTPLQNTLSYVKRKQDESEKLDYVIYDILTPQTFQERLELLDEYKTDSVIPAETFQVFSRDKLFDYFYQFREEGYEGLIARTVDGIYEDGKRSPNLLKLKAWMDGEFKVIDITSSVDGWAILTCEMPRDLNTQEVKRFSVSAPGDMVARTAVLLNRKNYIGMYVNVEYANLTEAGIPFHPIAKYWRI